MIKLKIQDKEGIPPDQQRLIAFGRDMGCKIFRTPTFEEKYRKRNIVIGSGVRSIRILFVNVPNFFITLRYSNPFQIKEVLEEFIDYAKNKFVGGVSDHGSFAIRLCCGDQLVYGKSNIRTSINNFRIHPIEVEDNPERGFRGFDYYLPRNDIWNLVIVYSPPNATLSDFQVSKDCTIHLVLALRGGGSQTSDLDSFGEYYIIPNYSYHTNPSRFGQGINLEFECTNPKCQTKKFIFQYSKRMIKNSHCTQPGESYDFKYDQENVKCCSCDSHSSSSSQYPTRFYFSNCYWKYSAIIKKRDFDKKSDDDVYSLNNLQKIESEWELAADGDDNYKIFDPREIFEKHKNVLRFQVQVRFYKSVGDDGNGKKLIHPDLNYCILCREKQRTRFVKIEGPNRFETSNFCESESCGKYGMKHWYHDLCYRKWNENETKSEEEEEDDDDEVGKEGNILLCGGCVKCSVKKINVLKNVEEEDEMGRRKCVVEDIISEEDEGALFKIVLMDGGNVLKTKRTFL